jgi:microcystin-dependent protein
MSVNNTNPTTLFGGTWVQIKDRFLLACGNTYTNGSTGGEATHKLTENEMPSHRHIGLSWLGDDANQSITLNSGSVNKGYNLSYSTKYTNGQEKNIQTRSAGGNQAHNNMPPYLAVYIWKRTA